MRSIEDDKTIQDRYVRRHLPLIGAVVLLALIGYSAYALYPLFALDVTVGSSLLLLAIAAGLASLFSPCSFPLLFTIIVDLSVDIVNDSVEVFRTTVGSTSTTCLTAAGKCKSGSRTLRSS